MSIIHTAFGQEAASKNVDSAFTSSTMEDENTVKREAKMEALTRLEGNPAEMGEELVRKTESAEQAIRDNGLKEVEEQRAMRNRLAMLRGTTALGIADPAVLQTMLYDASSRPTEAAAEAEIRNSLEDISLATADSEELDVLLAAREGKGLYDPILDRAEREAHMAALWQMAEKSELLPARGHRGMGQFAVDMTHMMALPLTSAGSRDLLTRPNEQFLDAAGVAFELKRDIEFFQSLPREEQLAQFPEILETIRDRADIAFGSHPNWQVDHVNRTLTGELISAFITGITDDDATLMNVFDAADAVPFVAGSAYLGARASGNMLKMSRIAASRRAATEMLQTELRAALREQRSPTGATKAEVVEEVLPEAVNTVKTPDDGISNGVDAMDTIQRMDEIMFLVKENTPGLNSLTPDELTDLSRSLQNNLSEELGRKVLDVHVGERMVGSGVTTPSIKAILGSTHNTGYRSPQALLSEAKALGFDPAHVKIRDNPLFNQSRTLSADEVVQQSTPVSRYDVRPNNDPIFRAMQANLGEGDGVILNPSRTDANLMLREGPVRVVATREGNVAILPESANLDTALDAAGVNRQDVGVGSYDPARGFDLETIDSDFQGVDGPFRLRRTTEPELSSEVIDAQEAVASAQDRVIRTQEEVFKLQMDGEAKGAKAHELEQKVRQELKMAQDDLADAQAKLDELGDPEVVINQQADGMYYMEVDVPVNANGAWTPFDKQAAGRGPFARWFLSGRAASDLSIMDLSTLGDGARSAFLAVVKDFIAPSFKKLRAREKRSLDILTEKMRAEEHWYTQAEAEQFYLEQYPNARRVPDRWHEAVEAYRTASDMDYFVRNAEIYNRASLDGYQTVSIDFQGSNGRWTSNIDEQNAKILRTPPSQLSEGRIMDLEDGVVLGANTRAYDASEIGAKGKYIVSLQEPTTVLDAAGNKMKVKHFVTDPQSVYGRSLEIAQLPYRPGGSHVQYGPQVRAWAKQAQEFKQGDGSGTILLNPRTYVGGTRPSELKPYVDRMNQAGRIAKSWVDGDITRDQMRMTLKSVLDRNSVKGLPSVEDFIEQVDNFLNGRDNSPQFNFNKEIEIVGDRELPSDYQAGNRTLDQVDGDLGGHESFMRGNGRLYYGRRGDRMLSPSGEELPILDAFDAMDRGLNNVAKIAGGSAYQKRAAEQFLATFADDLTVSFSGNTNAETVLRRLYQEINNPNIWKNGTDPKRIAQGKNQLAVAGRIANWDTPVTRQIRAGMIGLANKLDESGSRGNMFSQLASDAVHWSFKHDFGYGLRQMAFDIKLGLFNIAQFPMQISTAIALTAIDPVASGRAFLTYPIVRGFIGGSWSSKMLKEHMSKVSKITGLKGEALDNWVDMITELRRGQYTNLTGHSMQGDMALNEITGIANTNPIIKGLRSVREAGRVPFNEAEVFNRITAFQVAWTKMMRKYPEADVQSQAFRQELMGHTNDMAMNMTNNVRSASQSGVVSGATQFFAYPHRWLELMFTDNTSLTRTERARLIASQTALYGTSGTFVLSEISEWLKNNRGESPTFEEDFPGALMERGSLDALFYLATGQDHRYADRAEIASFLPQLFSDFFGQSKYGDTSAIEFLGGASISIGLDVGSDLMDVIMKAADEGPVAVAKWQMLTLSDDPVSLLQRDPDFVPYTALEVDDLLRNVSSYNNFRKAQGIWQDNQLRSAEDRFLADELDSQDAWSTLFSIPLQEQDILSVQMTNLKNRRESIDSAVQDGLRLRQMFERAETPEQRTRAIRLYALYLQSVDEKIRYRVAQDIQRYPVQSMLESTTRSLDKIEANETFVQALEEELERETNEGDN